MEKTAAAITPPPRKGARRRADVGPALRAAFNRGEAETLTLTELLVVDFAALLQQAFPHLHKTAYQAMAAAAEAGIVPRMQLAGRLLADEDFAVLSRHRSDVVRGWAAYALAAQTGDSLQTALSKIGPLATDPNSGVREWAWLALRPQVAAALPEALGLLEPWVHSPQPYVRRFAVEITRPRGVWCAHIPLLKEAPALGLPLLAPLQTESVKYPQDAVANWLNDAAKTQPAWVRQVCAQWQRAHPNNPATDRLCRRALRSIT